MKKLKKFSENELKFIKRVAEERAEGKTHLKTKSLMCAGRKDGSDYEKSLEGHYMGVAGEYAVAEAVKGFADFTPRAKGDKHSADVICRNKQGKECRICVKTTKYKDPIFKANSFKEIEDSTHVALCRYFNTKHEGVEIHWIKSVDSFKKKHYKRDFGYGMKMCLE